MAASRSNSGLTANSLAATPSEEPMDIETENALSTSQAKIGLLSHTLVSSPIIQWILPAHLRGKDQNDVVFVGERHLQIKEAVSGDLKEVTTKNDFDSYIMAAKVVNVSTELPWEEEMKLGSSNLTSRTNPDMHQDLPPQILVLSLASKELVFLYFWNAGGQFIYHHRPLPNDVSAFERFGRNIAVEPRSRAVAVSASCDYFGVFVLEKPPIIQSQMAQNKLDPIAEERFFRLEGDIIAMEFLYPKSEDSDKIILILLVAQDHLTHAVCYEWDANESLRQAAPRVTRKVLPLEDRLPTMLIPLTKTSSFLLVTTTSMAVYQNKLDPQRHPSRYPLPVYERESQKSPLWTRWARPLRNWLYNQKHDDIYLCREDGEIIYLGIGREGELENQTHLGQLCCDVDAAFDILDIGYEGGDLLLAAGTTGDGGLFVQKARDHPRCVQKFMNWTPVTDSVVVKNDNAISSDIAGDRLFVCSASSFSRGAVVELRHGVEAQIGLIVALEELSGTRDIWTMPDRISGGVLVLTSDPVSSLLLYLPADFGEELCAIDEAESGLDFGTQTLAAGCTISGAIIQVTDRSVCIGATPETSGYRLDVESGQTIVVAAIDGPTSLIAIAVRTQHEVRLHVKRLNISDGQHQLLDVNPPLLIQNEPICMTIEELDSSLFLFIGTGSGSIVVYSIADTVAFLLETNVMVGNEDDISKAIDSIAVIRKAGPGLYTVLCGLRSGILVPFGLSLEKGSADSPISLKQTTPEQLGHTSVKVQGKGEIALLTCGQGFWRASCAGGLADHTVQRIWITDQNNPAYHPKSIHSFSTSSSGSQDMDGLSGTLFCVADGQLMVCTLDQEAKTVPRRIDLPGSASKLAYSRHLRSLIVVYSQTSYDTDADPIKRYTRPFIEFVDPDLQHSLVDSLENPLDEEPRPWRPQGVAGEKISCILEWTPRKGDEEYHFIVIGTSRRNQQDRGRVIFLQAYRDPSKPSRIECSVKYIHSFEGPVFAIAPYGAFTLMVSTGHEIVPLEPKFSQTRWVRAARYSVLSPAILITAREPYLYLTTSRESLMVLKATEEKLSLHSYDRQKHDGLAHVYIGGKRKLILCSNRGGRVSLLTEHGITESNKMLPIALCEAHLPSSVMRLNAGSNKSPISSSSQVFYGNAMNGTVYRFLTVGEKEWRLLRLLQNLCIRDPIICPFTPRRMKQRNPMRLMDPQPSQMHIDGDILSRLLLRGPGHLMHMLNRETSSGTSTPGIGPGQTVLEQFAEVAGDALGEMTDPVESAMGWLQKILLVEF
ncbi:thermotolerance protein [Aspergillus sclerotioniger CBS 115572]|uniref:Thermotolerance protein n=1 Tax=Aspergillus sclerotioniger CBS 115572 TaxID=1450535 RepID=A0A317XCT4_9EURO|nr:thermotolerance protein [Aspergillus sclerotioniger CBS 115572]PWY95522.1 thermotolerance protein [Aspergillus sclerotioniger CBS 115572]